MAVTAQTRRKLAEITPRQRRVLAQHPRDAMTPEQKASRDGLCRTLEIDTKASGAELVAAVDAAIWSGPAVDGHRDEVQSRLTPRAQSGQPDQAQLKAAREYRAGRRERAKLAAADQAGTSLNPDDALYERIFPAAEAGPMNATEGLSAEETALYRTFFPTDEVGHAGDNPGGAEGDDALYREIFGDEG